MLAYSSFDTVPSPKGAATHIEAFVRALAVEFGPIHLVTPISAATPEPIVERWPGVLHTQLPAVGASLIDRVLCFRRFLSFWLAEHPCDAFQFRSIFEGYPLLQMQPRPKLVFEVNGLPSVELKYRYPRALDDRELMAKIVAQERACLDAADRIVTPSGVTRRFLGRYGDKTTVIPNGVDTTIFHPAVERPADVNLLYFGTLAAWQGVELAIRAVAQLVPEIPGVRLTVLGIGNSAQQEALSALALKLAIGDRVTLLPPVERAEVAAQLRRAFAVVAPLPVNDRNTRQGCCPLKILEGMAAGVPVIASDLPVVRDLGDHGVHLLATKPGSVDQIAAAVHELHADADLWQRIATNARCRVEDRFTWDHAGESLRAVWREVYRSITA